MAEIASGSIDLKSLKVAGEGASKYITEITGGDGITVHDSQNQTINYIKINSEGMEIYKGDANNSVAKFGNTVRIGKENAAYINMSATSFNIIDQVQYISLKTNGYLTLGSDISSRFTTDVGANRYNDTTHLIYLGGTLHADSNPIFSSTTYNENVAFIKPNTQFKVYFDLEYTSNPTSNTEYITLTKGVPVKNQTFTDSYGTVWHYSYNGAGRLYDFGPNALTYTIEGTLGYLPTQTSLGSGCYAGEGGTATGIATAALGLGSFSGGISSSAHGRNSFAFGRECIVTGERSGAIGCSLYVAGSKNFAIGCSNYISGDAVASFVGGYKCVVTGKQSGCIGNRLLVDGNAQFVIGKYNESNDDCAFIIGNGYSSRSNALIVDWDGNVWHQGDGHVDISSYITVTTGTLKEAVAIRYGKVVQIMLTVNNTSSVAAGSNIFAGTLNTNSGWIPRRYVTGGAYYGAHAIGGSLGTAGALVVRNASSTAVTISGSNTTTVSLTYILP